MTKIIPALAAMALSCLWAAETSAQEAPPAQAEPAQVLAPAATPEPAPAPAPVVRVVPKGTAILVEFPELISTRTAQRDQMFNLVLAEPVMLDGQVVIPAGTPGKGLIIDADKPGMGGQPGKLVLSGRYLEFNGKQVPIRGLKMSAAGKDNSGAAMAVGIVGGVFGLAVTGGHMEVQPGSRADAKLAADFVIEDTAPPEPSPAEPAPASEVSPGPVAPAETGATQP